ncbi:MAG: type I-E CRISPR-associated protein Cse1/CasA [Burkholderiales bacterium]|nr:type I-E CRISPR-associated protein Cse1/CasA [Burkholderiales bacterium]
MNLLHDPWMPVRRRDGSREWIAPNRLSDPDVVAFDAARPDFNGALAQFAIGLLQTTTPVDSSMTWRAFFRDPPSAGVLGAWFAPVSSIFELDGGGPRFMQDLDLGPKASENEVGALLIEAPGEKTLQDNKDHFVKRGHVGVMCLRCAAAALFTLQLNAPSGGAGHRTGVRGGGPLTTLVIKDQSGDLWSDLWLNVAERSVLFAPAAASSKTEPHLTFPWTAEIAILQKKGGNLAPVQVHPAHVYWAMPRRLRLEIEESEGTHCDICEEKSSVIVRRYRTVNYGLNYKGAWDHPLSPYYETKEGWLPVHPKAGELGYRHWSGWVSGMTEGTRKLRRARILDSVFSYRERQAGVQLRLWAFGYDMDNMKARSWCEATVPLYDLAESDPQAQRLVQSEVAMWLGAAEFAAYALRTAIASAWFRLEARGNLTQADAGFWGRSERGFYVQLKKLIDAARQELDPQLMVLRGAWHRVIVDTATHLFDEEFAGAGQVERENPRRIATAYARLRGDLYGGKIRKLLGLPEAPGSRSADDPKRTAA